MSSMIINIQELFHYFFKISDLWNTLYSKDHAIVDLKFYRAGMSYKTRRAAPWPRMCNACIYIEAATRKQLKVKGNKTSGLFMLFGWDLACNDSQRVPQWHCVFQGGKGASCPSPPFVKRLTRMINTR